MWCIFLWSSIESYISLKNLLAFSSVELYSCQTIVVIFIMVIREIEEVEEDA